MWMVKLCWAAPKHRVWNSCMNSGCFADCRDQAWKWGGCHNGSGCVAQSRGDPCAGNSHDGKQFLSLDGTEWEALVWLPVTPKPTTIEVGAKAQGARGIGEELERVYFSLIRL